MPVKQVVVVIDQCVIDGLAHEIVLDLETLLVQGMLIDAAAADTERDVLLTCPATGRPFRATVLLPKAQGEVITNVAQAT